MREEQSPALKSELGSLEECWGFLWAVMGWVKVLAQGGDQLWLIACKTCAGRYEHKETKGLKVHTNIVCGWKGAVVEKSGSQQALEEKRPGP